MAAALQMRFVLHAIEQWLLTKQNQIETRLWQKIFPKCHLLFLSGSEPIIPLYLIIPKFFSTFNEDLVIEQHYNRILNSYGLLISHNNYACTPRQRRIARTHTD